MKLVPISTIKGYEKYTKYYISDEGDLWSAMRKGHLRKLNFSMLRNNKTSWVCAKLTKRRSVSVGRLVAEAFLPNPTNSKRVNYINGDRMDCSVNNLSWTIIGVKKRFRAPKNHDSDLFDDSLIEQLEQVYAALRIKGYAVPDTKDFMNEFLKEALENYIVARGLRKILYHMNNNS
jgi:hypothetical protein